MNDPELATRIAIECLGETGLSNLQIEAQIFRWIETHGDADRWWEMSEELICRLARSLQKAFEKRYGSQNALSPTETSTDQHSEDRGSNGGGVLSRDGPKGDRS